MAEITSGSNVQTVIVLSQQESEAFTVLLQDWVDDSLARGITCGMTEVLNEYKGTVESLREVFDAFGVIVDIEVD